MSWDDLIEMTTMQQHHAIAGISGGRTSARMAYMVDAVLCFQNTGREHPNTLDFIAALEQDLGREIVRLEFRAPRRGEPPRAATFEIVEHSHLSRKGEPYRDMLDMCRAFRDKHNKVQPAAGCSCNNCKCGMPGPIAPWARSRICTAYLKVRVQRNFCRALGWGEPTEYTEYVGLRADEPKRLAKMRGRNIDRNTDERAPLEELGIVELDIFNFWAGRPFDLKLPKHLGNCTKCFLKDESDLATAMIDYPDDNQDWIDDESTYGPMRRGGRPSYAQVLAEASDRMAIRAALEHGDALIPVTSLSARRTKLITAQEIDRLRSGPTGISCECDAAKGDEFDMDNGEELAT